MYDNRSKNININFYKLSFIIFTGSFFIAKIGPIVNQNLAKSFLIISLLAVVVSVIKVTLFNRGCPVRKYMNGAEVPFFIFFGLQLIFQLYALFLVFLGKTSSEWISTNVTSFAIPIYFICLIILFQKDSIYVFTFSLIFSFYLAGFVNIIYYGPSVIVDVIRSVISSTNISPGSLAFEVHDTSFAAGVLLIFFFLSRGKIRCKKFILISLAIQVFFGQKRVEFLAIILIAFCYVCYRILKFMRIKNKTIFNAAILLFIFAFFISLIYVKMSLDGSLAQLLLKFDINMMGRDLYYRYMSRYAFFGIEFCGLGRNSTGHIIALSGYGVSNIHNDLLKMYLENGFVLFCLWLILFLFIIPIRLRKKYGEKCALKCIAMIAFLFICYTTDNLETYASVQVAFILCLYCTTLLNNKIQKGRIKDGNL